MGGGAVEPIVCGIETDLEALILHGDDGQVVDLADVSLTSQQEIEILLRSLYPAMHERVTFDLLPLIQGNIKYISMVRASNRPIKELEHNEWVLGVGRGFDWLHAINTAFIVGPFDPHLSFAIETAAKLLEGNIEKTRIDPNGIVLLTSSSFRDSAGPEHNLAKEKAIFLRKFSLDIIKQCAPKLMPYLQILTGCTNMNTRKFEVIERYNKVTLIDS